MPTSRLSINTHRSEDPSCNYVRTAWIRSVNLGASARVCSPEMPTCVHHKHERSVDTRWMDSKSLPFYPVRG